MPKHEMPDPEKIKEILEVVSEKVPHLLKEISDVFYAPKQAKNYAVSIATFYNELKKAGMPEAKAYELTREYMSNLSLKGLGKGFGHHHCHNDDDD